ncbi:MAG: DUF3524 domain-containing protein [Bacteroidota bacterium]
MSRYTIQIVEPFYTGSHRQWAEGWQQHSQHDIQILSLPGRHWKWRMYGGAVTLAQRFAQQDRYPDLLVFSDMVDVTTFLALTRKYSTAIPTAMYCHENQITYPWSPTDADVALQRNNQYGFLNYTSALAVDRLWFNSEYHLHSFTDALPDFLRQFPDYRGIDRVATIRKKSRVLSLGMDLQRLAIYRPTDRSPNDAAVILWNHRWEYDKQPRPFFELLFRLKDEGIDFQLVVLGASYQQQPSIFAEARRRLADRLIHYGYAPDLGTYARLLWQSDVLPVTSQQDFFGGSVVEAIFCQTFPLLPHRLAYPEHIPEALQARHLYNDERELYEKLKSFLIHYPQSNALKEEQQNFVVGYDWSTLADEYDSRASRLIALFS